MSTLCILCNNNVSLPYNLNCDHTFCYLCIKTYYLSNNKKCPTCNTDILDNLSSIQYNNILEEVNNRSTFWLYSSNHPNFWYAYDKKSNDAINTLYVDYFTNNQANNKNKHIAPVSLSIGNDGNGNSGNNNNNSSQHNNNFVPLKVNGDDNNYVNFKDDGKMYMDQAPLSYIINIGSFEYQIDFKNMKQSNVMDPSKKRTIKLLEYDPVKDNPNVINFLKNNNVLGISGIKFEINKPKQHKN